jgi:hypothetical protein
MLSTGDLYLAAVAANRTFRSALANQFGDPAGWEQDYESSPQLWGIDVVAAHALKLASEERIPPVFLPIELEEIDT